MQPRHSPRTDSSHIIVRHRRQIERGSQPRTPLLVRAIIEKDSPSPIIQAKRLGLADTHSGGETAREQARHEPHRAAAQARRQPQQELGEEEGRDDLERQVIPVEVGESEGHGPDDHGQPGRGADLVLVEHGRVQHPSVGREAGDVLTEPELHRRD